MKPSDSQRHELATITLHPGWSVLRELMGRVGDEVVQGMARRILSGKFPTEAEAAYMRGYRPGIQDTLGSPQQALASLKRLAAGEPEE